MTWEPWKTEAAMVADFVAWVAHDTAGHRNREAELWTVYAETAGWDLLLVRQADGFQIGVEAKLSLNAAVLCQVIEHERGDSWGRGSPDCHAVLVPRAKAVNGLSTIARRLGIVVITGSEPDRYRDWKGPAFSPSLPRIDDHLYLHSREAWPERCPDERCKLPEYVPDVTGGHSAPVKLTQWKIAAIKAQILLETRGYITRADLKALKMSPTRWTQDWLKSNGEGGWVTCGRMPDFKAQHPVNYEQIKADFPKWSKDLPATVQPLIPGAAA